MKELVGYGSKKSWLNFWWM